MPPDKSPPPNAPSPLSASNTDIHMTVVQPQDELKVHRTNVSDSPAVGPAAGVPQSASHGATVFRPVHRPAMAILQILDDDQTSAEIVRLRADRTVIGRGDGDIKIPHDTLMSTRHAEITRSDTAGECTWQLTDLGSTNGTFLRAAQARLKDGDVFMVGGHLFRFVEAKATAAQGADPKATSHASLVPMTSAGESKPIVLDRTECWIGSDPGLGAGGMADDATLDPKHLLLHRDPSGQWRAKDTNSVNGLWIRVQQARLRSGCTFQLGEQRFNFFIQ